MDINVDGITEDRLRRQVRSGKPPDDDPELAEAGLRHARRNRLAVTAVGLLVLMTTVLAVTSLEPAEDSAWMRWLVWSLLGLLTLIHGVIAPLAAFRNVRRAEAAVVRASP